MKYKTVLFNQCWYFRFRCTNCDEPIDVVEVYVPDTDNGTWINIGTSDQLKGRLSFIAL